MNSALTKLPFTSKYCPPGTTHVPFPSLDSSSLSLSSNSCFLVLPSQICLLFFLFLSGIASASSVLISYLCLWTGFSYADDSSGSDGDASTISGVWIVQRGYSYLLLLSLHLFFLLTLILWIYNFHF